MNWRLIQIQQAKYGSFRVYKKSHLVTPVMMMMMMMMMKYFCGMVDP